MLTHPVLSTLSMLGSSPTYAVLPHPVLAQLMPYTVNAHVVLSATSGLTGVSFVVMIEISLCMKASAFS